MNKQCPLKEDDECNEEKCAWWFERLKRCAILDMALSLDVLYKMRVVE